MCRLCLLETVSVFQILVKGARDDRVVDVELCPYPLHRPLCIHIYEFDDVEQLIHLLLWIKTLYDLCIRESRFNLLLFFCFDIQHINSDYVRRRTGTRDAKGVTSVRHFFIMACRRALSLRVLSD